jgi:hypothetical protein
MDHPENMPEPSEPLEITRAEAAELVAAELQIGREDRGQTYGARVWIGSTSAIPIVRIYVSKPNEKNPKRRPTPIGHVQIGKNGALYFDEVKRERSKVERLARRALNDKSVLPESE